MPIANKLSYMGLNALFYAIRASAAEASTFCCMSVAATYWSLKYTSDHLSIKSSEPTSVAHLVRVR